MIGRAGQLAAVFLLGQIGQAFGADIPACDPKQKAQEFFAQSIERKIAALCKYGTFAARIYLQPEQVAGCNPQHVAEEFDRLLNRAHNLCRSEETSD